MPTKGARPTTSAVSVRRFNHSCDWSITAPTVSARESASRNVSTTAIDAFGRWAAMRRLAARPAATPRSVAALESTSSDTDALVTMQHAFGLRAGMKYVEFLQSDVDDACAIVKADVLACGMLDFTRNYTRNTRQPAI
jgi:hypothetical protein